jgi:putrescine aminotransferase
MSTTAAAVTIQTLQEEKLVENSAEMGHYFLAGLQRLCEQFPALIKDVRGRGLFIGVEIVNAVKGDSVAARLFERNVLVAYTLNKPEVIRIEPPLIITRQLIDQVLERFEDALKEEVK